MIRKARCRCGKLTATIAGEPIRVSVCHCNSCRLSTGGAFSAQARFPVDAVTIAGEWKSWDRAGDSGSGASYRWCPVCGSTIGYVNRGMDDQIAILLGAIVEGGIPTPGFSMFQGDRMPWVQIVGEAVVHD